VAQPAARRAATAERRGGGWRTMEAGEQHGVGGRAAVAPQGRGGAAGESGKRWCWQAKVRRENI
jgi:hypothetical protein